MDLETENLKKLVERAKKGDQGAFGEIYGLYFSPLYKFVYFRVGNKADTDDIVQETFLKAIRAFSGYSYRGISPLSYFYTIARNTIIDSYRKENLGNVVSFDTDFNDLVDESDSPEEKLSKQEEIRLIKRSLANLTDGEKEILTLKFLSGLSNKEISIILNKSEEALWQLQSRGLRHLRVILKKQHNGTRN
jgi:RNA polymerase sigma-70 factor, ECF subfamily